MFFHEKTLMLIILSVRQESCSCVLLFLTHILCCLQKEHMQFEIKQGAMSALEAESVFEELDKSQDGLLTRVEHR